MDLSYALFTKLTGRGVYLLFALLILLGSVDILSKKNDKKVHENGKTTP